jgi:hypothetical protein
MIEYQIWKNGVQTNGWFSDSGKDHTYYEPNFGLPERDELDENGNPTGNRLPAEYELKIIDRTAQHALAECLAKRVAEYPTPSEFLNAFFDGGQAALDVLQAKRLAVKAKYPKPQV